ncbi:unnamed protein product [Auanema sp. JU1783]|nr:unnamed protein product [Auanema sp. JU1783]
MKYSQLVTFVSLLLIIAFAQSRILNYEEAAMIHDGEWPEMDNLLIDKYPNDYEAAHWRKYEAQQFLNPTKKSTSLKRLALLSARGFGRR